MNKTKFKYTIPGQLLKPLSNHAVTALFLAFFWLLTLSLWSSNTGQYIFTSFGTLIYFLSIYGAGFEIATDDKKPYNDRKSIWYKGILLPVVLTLVNILVIVVYKCSWAFGSADGFITNGWSLTGNILSVAWFSPYKTFLGMNRGHFELQGYLIIIFLPYIASFLGYFAGYKDFDIYSKISAMTYEKKK